jgi:hypothetical protein
VLLGLRDIRRVTWRRSGSHDAYVGHVTVTDDAVRLSRREVRSGIDASIAIPAATIRAVRAAAHVVVLELAGGETVTVEPVAAGRREVETVARRIAAATR